MSSKKTTWDWSGTHTPVWAAANCVGTTFSATVIADLAHLSPAWALAAGAAGAGATILSRLRHRLTTATATVRSGLWLTFGGWSSHAIASDPWAVNNIATLTVGGIVAYGLTHATNALDANAQADAAQQLIYAQHKDNDDAWAERMKRVCRIEGCRIVGTEQYKDDNGKPTGRGYTIEVQMPIGGAGLAEVQRSTIALANDLRLAPGCGVDARQGADRSLVLIDVTTADVFADMVPFGDDYSPLTINEPFPVGVFRNGTPAEVYLREDSGMVIGQRRSGKTNQLNVFIAQFARMVDCLVWVIDFNAGALALPWITPWKEAHETDRGDDVPNPVVDWVASTPEEAEAMTAAALRIAKTRKTAYQDRKRAKNVTLLPIDRDVPEVFIVIDECAELLGQDAMTKNMRGTPMREAAENVAEIQRIAGDSGVNVLICGLRSTNSVIADTGIKKGARAKLQMRSDDPAEYGFTFSDYALDPNDVPNKGTGFIRTDGGKPRPFKGNVLMPAQMEDIAKATAAIQPPLDAISAKAAGDVYASRWDWDRYGHLFAGAPVAATAGVGENNAPAISPDNPTANWAREATADWRALEAQRKESAEQRMRELDERAGRDAEIEAEFRRLTASLLDFRGDGPVDPADPSTWQKPTGSDVEEAGAAPARGRMLTLLEEAGRDGLTAAELVEALGVSKKTVYQHLGFHQEQGTVGKLNVKPARYALRSFYAGE